MYDNQNFLYGVAYYYEYKLPEYMTGVSPRDRMKKDFQMIRDAGMNVIRIAESTWSTIEPEEGVYSLDHVDAMLEEVENAGLKVIIGTPTYAVPSWMAKKYPDILDTSKAGRQPYGSRQIMDCTNPDFRRMAQSVIEVLISHVAGNPTVIGYQVDNETKHFYPYSKSAQEKFLEYLKKEYETPQSLNEAFGLAYWSNSIHSWEDFPDIRGTINGGLGCEYLKFLREMAAQFLDWQTKIVKKYARPGQFVTHNLDFEWRREGVKGSRAGYSYGVQPGISHYEISKFIDVNGTDIYHPSQDQLTGREIAYGGDSIRALNDRNYLVLETESQGFWQWTPYPGQIFLQAMSHLASGAEMIEYWNWNSLHNSFETYWKGILSHDMHENRIYREVAETAKKIHAVWPQIRGLKKNNRIALLVSNEAQSAIDEYFRLDPKFSYSHAVRWVFNALYDLNLECDVLDVKRLEEEPELAGRYRMILTPLLYTASDRLIDLLRSFVGAGGVLVSTFKSFFTDGHITVRPNLQPYHLVDVFGVYYQEFAQAGSAKVDGKKAKYFLELLEKTKGSTAEILASYEHPFWKDYAAVTKNRYGDGWAFYIGTHVSRSVLKKYLLQAAACAEITPCGGDAGGTPASTWPVTIRSGVNENGKTVRFILHYSGAAEEWACPFEGKELLAEKTVGRGDTVTLEPWGVLVILEN